MLLPKAPDFGDAIILRGKLKPDAKKCVRIVTFDLYILAF